MSSGSNGIRDGGSDDCSFFDDDIVKLILQRENHKNPSFWNCIGRRWTGRRCTGAIAKQLGISRYCWFPIMVLGFWLVMMMSINVLIFEYYRTLKSKVEELKG
ncbi:unnamed protein product [Brassica oleracea]